MATESQRRILLIGLDGADWKILSPLMERGELPAFARLVANGVMGRLATLQPTLSPILWNSIATGKRAGKHGIHGFTEVDPQTGGVRPVTSTSRKCKALWNILTQSGRRTHVVNWFAGHPAEPINGAAVSDFYPEPTAPPGQPWPLRAGTIHPERLASTLAEYRVRPSELDEHVLKLFVPEAAKVDQARDRRLARLALELAKAFSVHAATTWLIEHEPWDFAAVYFRTIDMLCHLFMPYRAPRLPGVSEEDFALYQHVVDGAYCLFDRFIERLLHLAGPDVTVMIVSDHGFHSDTRRPALTENPFADPEAWHRSHGILLLRGPGIRQDDLVHGAGLLDVAPTILALYGLPVGRDMDGRVLAEVFVQPPDIQVIESWETVPGSCGLHSGAAQISPEDAEMLLRQFVALGYIEPLEPDKEKAAAQTVRANRWNLARDYMDAGRFLEALPLLEDLQTQAPQQPAFTQHLAICLWRLGLAEEAEATLAGLIDLCREPPFKLFLRGTLECERGRLQTGLEYLLQAEQAGGSFPGLLLRIGRTYVKLGQPAEAARLFERVAETDSESSEAWLGLAQCRLRQRRFEEAAGLALKALALHHALPPAHLCLGLALARLGQRERAIQALRTALVYAPGWLLAHRALVHLYAQKADSRDELAFQQNQLRKFQARRREASRRLETLREQVRQRSRERTRLQPQPVAEDAPPAPTNAVVSQTERGARLDTPAPASPPKEFILVSGLPRSGTSLMMQMLAAGGLAPLTDGKRPPDEDNPEGYFEWEDIRKLPKNPTLIEQADGKVVKVISMLLPHLPRHHRYRLIWMERPVEEIAASQRRMTERRRASLPTASLEHLATLLGKHRDRTLLDLAAWSNFAVLQVNYPALVHDPSSWIARLVEFLGPERLPNPGAMRQVIKPSLHRQRAVSAAA
jgi:predicted AlkP superfamily phosphohydrolase/phosphomutase/tetratricopeptide (TPR) repeat protein